MSSHIFRPRTSKVASDFQREADHTGLSASRRSLQVALQHVIPKQINRWTPSDSKTTHMTIGEYQRPDLYRHVVNVVKRS